MSKSSKSQTPSMITQSEIEEQIAFVLAHPGMSAWLKNALGDALSRDPICVLNDLEILNQILRNRSALLIAEKYN